MDSEKSLTGLLNLKFDIEKNYFKKTVILNSKLEELYQENLEKYSLKDALISQLMIFLGYLGSLIFVLFAYYLLVNLLICLCLFAISLTLTAISLFNTNKKFKFFNAHIQILLLFLNLSAKCIIVCLIYNTPSNDNEGELLRIIIYQSLMINIFIITSLEANIFLTLFYMLINFITITMSIIYTSKNHYFYLEFFINFFISLIFYMLRKEWDYKLRALFAEKYKFEVFYLYTLDYLNGLNGYTLNIKNNSTIFFNNKINYLVNSIIKNNRIENLIQKATLNGETNYNPTKVDLNKKENESSVINEGKMTLEINNYHESGNEIVFFLKNLIFIEKFEDNNNEPERDIRTGVLKEDVSKGNFFSITYNKQSILN